MRLPKYKKTINTTAFAPNMFDPLGMYGCFPAILNFDEVEPLDTPTQDADDL